MVVSLLGKVAPHSSRALSKQACPAQCDFRQRASAERERRRPPQASLWSYLVVRASVGRLAAFCAAVALPGEDGAAAPPASRDGVFAVPVTLQKLSQFETLNPHDGLGACRSFVGMCLFFRCFCGVSV